MRNPLLRALVVGTGLVLGASGLAVASALTPDSHPSPSPTPTSPPSPSPPPSPTPTPAVELVAPRNDEMLTGVVELAAAVDGAAADSVTFQYAPDGSTWSAIATAPFPSDRRWSARWDTTAAPSGPVYIRASFQTAEGSSVVSPAVRVRLARLPIAEATATAQPDGTIAFDGSESSHPDPAARIEHWIWDFGDGTSDVGPLVSHTYESLDTPYSGSLTVIDGDGNQSAFYFALNLSLAPEFKAEDKCVCKKITLRGAAPPQKALGPKGDGSEPWPAVEDDMDGQTLGRLSKNPGNKDGLVGWAFEIAAQVEGDPGKCKEIQVVKKTVVWGTLKKEDCLELGDVWDDTNKKCSSHKFWVGTKKDLDLDGNDDIDVSTKAKCEGAGGIFSEAKVLCLLRFPYSGQKFGADEYLQGGPGGAYEAPHTYKKHVGTQVLWWDHPYFRSSGGVGTTGDWHFVSFLRGTDQKYCYVSFALATKLSNDGPREAIKQTGTGVGKDKVPSVP